MRRFEEWILILRYLLRLFDRIDCLGGCAVFFVVGKMLPTEINDELFLGYAVAWSVVVCGLAIRARVVSHYIHNKAASCKSRGNRLSCLVFDGG